jgi:hypothetical protein
LSIFNEYGEDFDYFRGFGLWGSWLIFFLGDILKGLGFDGDIFWNMRGGMDYLFIHVEERELKRNGLRILSISIDFLKFVI